MTNWIDHSIIQFFDPKRYLWVYNLRSYHSGLLTTDRWSSIWSKHMSKSSSHFCFFLQKGKTLSREDLRIASDKELLSGLDPKLYRTVRKKGSSVRLLKVRESQNRKKYTVMKAFDPFLTIAFSFDNPLIRVHYLVCRLWRCFHLHLRMFYQD